MDEKILFGKISHHLDSEIRKNNGKRHVFERKFHFLFWVMIYNGIEFELQCH